MMSCMASGVRVAEIPHPPLCGFLSLPWEEFVLEHNRHASTVDLLIQGEFGWDEEFHYALQWAGPMGPNWCKYITVPWIPVIHFFGLNDTGSLFGALEWWMHFPDDTGGKCKEF